MRLESKLYIKSMRLTFLNALHLVLNKIFSFRDKNEGTVKSSAVEVKHKQDFQFFGLCFLNFHGENARWLDNIVALGRSLQQFQPIGKATPMLFLLGTMNYSVK